MTKEYFCLAIYPMHVKPRCKTNGKFPNRTRCQSAANVNTCLPTI
jgi:hypothetical protein